jgi:hypothetical protein
LPLFLLFLKKWQSERCVGFSFSRIWKMVRILDGRTNVTMFQKLIRVTPDTKFIRSIFSNSENPVTNLTLLSSEEEIGDGFVNQSERGIWFSFSQDRPSLESKWSMIIINGQVQHVLFVMKWWIWIL